MPFYDDYEEVNHPNTNRDSGYRRGGGGGGGGGRYQDRSGGGGGGGGGQRRHQPPIHTEKIFAERKTFFLDLKENDRGRVLKITEDVRGRRDTIMVPIECIRDLIEALQRIDDVAGGGTVRRDHDDDDDDYDNDHDQDGDRPDDDVRD